MKIDGHRAIDQYRIRTGRLASDPSDGNNGAFMVPFQGMVLSVIVSDGMDWDHVSVSTPKRCPTWEEMCFVKDLLFEPHEVAMQLHPAADEYVNHHPFCLHIWRPQNRRIPTPPTVCVGPLKREIFTLSPQR